MLVRGVAALAVMLFLAAGPSAGAAPSIHLAQASPTAKATDVTRDLPSATWLLVVAGIGLAVYVSYRLGHKPPTETRRREGPISRALRQPHARTRSEDR